MHRVRGYRDGELPTQVHCPDCGRVNVHADVWDKGQPISAVCPDCGERLYFADSHDEEE
jgi:transcription elongation factor Elf1